MSADLVAFLRARLDEDERVARAANRGPWEVGPAFGARDGRVYEAGSLVDSVGTCVFAAQVANQRGFRGNAEHIACHDPARVLREVEAKRGIVAEYEGSRWSENPAHPGDEYAAGEYEGFRAAMNVVAHQMASAYADHPDYREEWRP